jgi:hypothetical protein
MGGNRTRRLLSRNEEAVSEEYTALPALCVVVIGLALFFLLLAHAYAMPQAQSETTRTYHTAELLTEKLLDPANAFIQSGGILDLDILTGTSVPLDRLRQDNSPSGFDFLLRLTTANTTITIPANVTIPTSAVAASRTIPVALSPAQTIPGRLTVVVWRT